MNLKTAVSKQIHDTLSKLQQSGELPTEVALNVRIERCKNPEHGDFATNIAMMLAKPCKKKPRDIAETISAAIPTSDLIESIDIAGPGFINIRLTPAAWNNVIADTLSAGKDYGSSKLGQNQRVLIEYVSANPTGPLHVGHGRGAAYGACLYNLLKAAGYDVHAEYYVNDAGRQMRILALSVWIRYLQSLDEKISLPEKAYHGDYIVDIAKALHDEYETRFFQKAVDIEKALPEDADPKEMPESYVDMLVDIAIQLLGENDFNIILQAALNSILDDIKEDLAEFGVTHNTWFLESRLHDEGLIDAGINLLRENGFVFEKEGATWFRATEFGDEKDRVLIRANGQYTYFAADVGYHLYKYNQQYDCMIDIFGADHHGYITRIQAFLRAVKEDPDKLKVLLVQFAILYRGKNKVQMSTRSGSFVTLRELRNEVGNDAARYFYIMRKPEQHLDFDLELAKSQSNENPVYYIQYAHARICSVWRQLDQSEWEWDEAVGTNSLALLNNEHEQQLIRSIAYFPDLIETAALNYEPHSIAHYLQELANQFHSYYNAHKFLIEDDALRNARLCLVNAVQIVLTNGLTLLGLTAPEQM